MAYKNIGMNIEYYAKRSIPKETQSDIERHAKEKIEIVNDFFYPKNQLKANELNALYDYLCTLKSITAIDDYFKKFINART